MCIFIPALQWLAMRQTKVYHYIYNKSNQASTQIVLLFLIRNTGLTFSKTTKATFSLSWYETKGYLQLYGKQLCFHTHFLFSVLTFSEL
jgi:hypothetical protein